MRGLLVGSIALALSACATAPTPAPTTIPTKPYPPPASAAGSVFIRLFDGVLTLPPGYVFEGNQLGDKSLFQGPTGGVRIGPRVELSSGYLDFAQHTLKAREDRCGLEILRHGGDDPPLWLLLGKTHYALLYDRDPARVPAMIDGYCASISRPKTTP
jgi:hypothetical protein